MDRIEWSAERLLETSGGYWRAFCLHTAIVLEVFSVIGDEKVTAHTVAERMKAHHRATAMLLNALVAMGLLIKNRDWYQNTPQSRSLLTKGSPQYIGHIISHHHHLVDAWAKLDQAVKEGRPTRAGGVRTEAEREAFLMGMFNVAMAAAPRLAKDLDLGGKRRLLDLGGGPGTYAIHFCLMNPDLEATVFDLPTTRPFAEKTIARFGLSDRVRFLAGDYLKEDIPGRYDVAWLSQILHSEGPEACQEIIKRATAVLEPGGRLFVHEFILDDSLDGPLFPALFSLNMLVNTTDGRAYSEGQIKDMLTQAGLGEIQRLPYQGPNDTGIICGVR